MLTHGSNGRYMSQTKNMLTYSPSIRLPMKGGSGQRWPAGRALEGSRCRTGAVRRPGSLTASCFPCCTEAVCSHHPFSIIYTEARYAPGFDFGPIFDCMELRRASAKYRRFQGQKSSHMCMLHDVRHRWDTLPVRTMLNVTKLLVRRRLLYDAEMQSIRSSELRGNTTYCTSRPRVIRSLHFIPSGLAFLMEKVI